MTQKVLRTYFSFVFLFELAMSFPFSVYVLFLLSQKMNLFQVSLVNMVFMSASFLLEIPTGAFADTLGRKFSFVVSCIVISIAFFVYFLSHSFWQFILAELIAALGIAFHSGAFQSWVVDSLKHYNYQGSMEKVFSREEQVRIIALIIGPLIGGFAGQYNLALPWLMSAIGMLIVGIVAYFVMKEPYFDRKSFGIKKIITEMKSVAVDSFAYGLKNKIVFTIVCFSAIQAFCVQSPNMYWQPGFAKLSTGTSTMGWLFMFFALATIIGNKIAVWIMKVFKDGKIGLVISQFVVGSGLIVASVSSSFYLVLMPFLVHEAGRGIYMPIKSKYLNEHIPSKQRATVISFDAMFFKIGSALGLLVMGLVAKNISIPFAWLISGAILILGTSILYLKRRG